MQQVAVRGVDLEDPEPRAHRAPCGGCKREHDVVDLTGRHRFGHRIPVVERNRARRERRTPPALLHGEPLASLPRDGSARFAPGVGELHARDCASLGDEARDGSPRGRLRVEPDAAVGGRDATARLDRGRLAHHKRCAADRAAAEVNEVPGRRAPLERRILAHRRHGDAVLERYPGEIERCEQVHGSFDARARKEGSPERGSARTYSAWAPSVAGGSRHPARVIDCCKRPPRTASVAPRRRCWIADAIAGEEPGSPASPRARRSSTRSPRGPREGRRGTARGSAP